MARKSHQDSAVRFVTAKTWPENATKTRQYDLLRPNVGQKEPPRLGSTICYGQELARKSHQDSAVRFVTAKRGPERATKARQYDLLRPRVDQKEPPRLGSTICYGQELARKSHQDSAVRFVTAKRGPERATKTRQYELLRPRVGQKKPPRLGSTICYGQQLARKSHQDLAVRFVTANRKSHRDSAVRSVTAKRGPERATKTRQYDLLRPRVGQNMPPRLGSTICYGQTWARRATKTRQYDLLRPNVGQKEPPRLGSTICYGQELARKSHRDSAVRFVTATANGKSHQDAAVRFVTAKSCPERATKTRQYDLLRRRVGQKEPPYDLLRPRVGKKEPPRLGTTTCCGQTWARKSHQDSDLIRPRVGQKEPPRLGSTICYGQEFGQKEPPRLGSTIRYGQTCARKSHQDSAVRFVTAKSWPERATSAIRFVTVKLGQKEPPRLGSTICYGQTWARKSHQDSAVRFVTAKSWPEEATKTRQYDLLRPRVGQKIPPRLGRQYDLLRPNVGQKEPPRLGSTICYGQELARKSHQDSAVRFVTAKRGPERATKARQYDLLRPNVGQKSHQDSAVRFVTAKRGPERATETRQYDLLRSKVGIKTRQYDLLRPRVGQNTRLGSTICYGQELARKSHQDSAVRFVTAKRGPERATKTRQYDLLRPRVVQKEPPRLGSTICYGQELARKSHQDSAVRFVTAKRGPERATKTRQYDLLRPRVGQKKPPRCGSTLCYCQELAKKTPRLGSAICYGQTWARKSHQNSAVRFVTAKRGPERATKTRQYDLLRPRVGQKEPPRLGSTICYGQELARKSHQDSAVRFGTAKRGPPRLGSTICHGQEWARKSHQDSAVRFVTAKSWPEKATKTWQYDLLRPTERATETRQCDLLLPNVGQKEPPRLGSTICYGQELSRKSHQDSAVRFVTAKRGPERATETRQYGLSRPRGGQKEPPRLGSTICYGQTWARKSHQDSAVRFVTAKSWPERATETRQYDLLRPNVGQKEPPRLGSTICYGQTCHRDSAA